MIKFTEIDVCNYCQTVKYLKGWNDDIDLFQMEEEFDFTTSFFVNPPTFDQYYIEKTTTNLKMKKSLSKQKETEVVIGHDSRCNDGDSMR